jgi:hypothetical protein
MKIIFTQKDENQIKIRAIDLDREEISKRDLNRQSCSLKVRCLSKYHHQ